jgi:hypothetical protein
MEKKIPFFKFCIITIIFFIFLDLLIGKYLYRNFIRGEFIDADHAVGIKHDIFLRGFKKSYKTNTAGWGSIRFTLCTDPNGFRSACKNQYRYLKDFDIGFIGDSNTEPVGINYEDSFVGIIDNEFKDKKIANLATASSSPAIYYAKINFLLSNEYKFKEIVVFIDPSDMQEDVACYGLEDDVVVRKMDSAICISVPLNLNEKIFTLVRSNLKLSFVLFKTIHKTLNNLGLFEYKMPNKILNDPRSSWTHNYNKKYYNDLDIKQSIDITIKNMEKLSDLLKRNNIDLSVAVYPFPGTLKYDTPTNAHVKLWEKFCEKNCKSFYNLMHPFFDEVANSNVDAVYRKFWIKDDVHFNEKGNKLIANNFLKLHLK